MPDPSDQDDGPMPDRGPMSLDQLYREILHLREFLTQQLQAVSQGNEQRLAGMDKAILLTQQYPTLLDQNKVDQTKALTRTESTLKEIAAAAVATLEALHDQKFALSDQKFVTIDVRLADLDKLIGQTTAASKEAINAAFSAQKEAGALLATQTKEQINALQTLFNTTNNAASDKINALDRRMTTMEGRKQGGDSTWMGIAAAIGAIVGIVGIIAAVIAFADGRAAQQPQIIYQSPPPSIGQSSIVTPIVPQK